MNIDLIKTRIDYSSCKTRHTWLQVSVAFRFRLGRVIVVKV